MNWLPKITKLNPYENSQGILNWYTNVDQREFSSKKSHFQAKKLAENFQLFATIPKLASDVRKIV